MISSSGAWLLVWVFLAPEENIDLEIPHAAAKEIPLHSRQECEEALNKQLNVNDTRWMITHNEARLVCVQLPVEGQLPWPVKKP